MVKIRKSAAPGPVFKPAKPAPAAEPAGAPAQPVERSQPMRFRRSTQVTRLPVDAVKRQGQIAQIAWLALGGRDEAIAFLNTHDAVLDGRPLDLATQSEEGFAAVERAIAELASAVQA